MMMRRAGHSRYTIPAFDDAILKPEADENVLVYRTRPNQEFALETFCKESGIVCYLPVRRCMKVHNFMQKGIPYSYSNEVLRPFFPTYIFLRLSPLRVNSLRESTLFARCVPLRYSQERLLEDIRTVRIIETIGFEQELEIHSEIPQGGCFVIASGIWTGVKGYLVSKDGVNRWTVRIDFCQRSVTTTIEPARYKMIPVNS